jgi:NAD-dependent SIR2 family protein deacetylase
MRFNFPPTHGYTWLLELASSFSAENIFCWTSNIDGCFERAGFDPTRVYTTQGEMNRFQCARPGCSNVWNCEEQLRAIDSASPDGVLTNLTLIPKCPKCESTQTLPNLRGGDWFNHKPYEAVAQRLLEWLDDSVAKRASVAILEIGVGPNTPIVTRIPAAAFASALHCNGGQAVYLRVNPDEPEDARENPVAGVNFQRWQQSWTVLQPLLAAVTSLRAEAKSRSQDESKKQTSSAPVSPNQRRVVSQWQQKYRDILLSLYTPRLAR